jgi:hypothetical protein
MLNAPYARTHAAEADRHAYNVAFDALGLGWHWDAATYASVQARGRDGLRSYLEAQHPHQLRAYDADFLAIAIEAAKARCHTAFAASRRGAAPHTGRAPDSSTHQAA